MCTFYSCWSTLVPGGAHYLVPGCSLPGIFPTCVPYLVCSLHYLVCSLHSPLLVQIFTLSDFSSLEHKPLPPHADGGTAGIRWLGRSYHRRSAVGSAVWNSGEGTVLNHTVVQSLLGRVKCYLPHGPCASASKIQSYACA